MKFDVEVNDQDYIEFNNYHLVHSRSGKRALILMRLIIPVAIFIMELVGTIAGQEKDLGKMIPDIVMMLFFVVLWEIILIPLMKSITKRSIVTMKKDGKLPYHEKAHIEIGETALIESTDSSTQTIRKEDFLEVAETKDYIFAYFGSQQALIIPKRCVCGMEDEIIKEIKNVKKILE